MELGAKIIQYRKNLQMSQGALAEKLNVSRQAISKWENDTALPDIANTLALAKIFGISLDEFLENDVPQEATITTATESPTLDYQQYLGQRCDFILKSGFHEVQRNVVVLGVKDNFILVKKGQKYRALGIPFIHSVMVKEPVDVQAEVTHLKEKKLTDLITKCHVYTSTNEGRFGDASYLFAELLFLDEETAKLQSGKNSITLASPTIILISGR